MDTALIAVDADWLWPACFREFGSARPSEGLGC
jgi:hypothetical protein